jgi:DNA excision repair protein ERCC-3
VVNEDPVIVEPQSGPLIVQSDQTLLLEIDHPDAEECRREIAAFAELERSPEHVHTYRMTPLGLWNARAAGIEAAQVSASLHRWSRFPLSESLLTGVAETMARYGRLVLEEDPRHGLVLSTHDRPVMEEIVRTASVVPLLGPRIDHDTVAVYRENRGRLKQALI